MDERPKPFFGDAMFIGVQRCVYCFWNLEHLSLGFSKGCSPKCIGSGHGLNKKWLRSPNMSNLIAMQWIFVFCVFTAVFYILDILVIHAQLGSHDVLRKKTRIQKPGATHLARCCCSCNQIFGWRSGPSCGIVSMCHDCRWLNKDRTWSATSFGVIPPKEQTSN